MDGESAKSVRLVHSHDSMPPPVFANNIQAMSTQEFTTLTFYAAVLPMAYGSPEELPDHIEARCVAQVVVPQSVWAERIGNIIAKREAENPASDEER